MFFLNFLRGMETAACRAAGGRSAGFLNFLRGMETCGVGGAGAEVPGLPKLP